MPFFDETQQQQPLMQPMPQMQVQQPQPVMLQPQPMVMPAVQQTAAFPQDIQDQLLNNMRQEMDDQIRSRKGAKVQQLLSDVSGLVGPAIAAFGKGPGVTGGGVALMHAGAQAAQDTKARIAAEKMQHQNALQSYIQMYNTVGLKPAQKAIDNQIKQNKTQTEMAWKQQLEAGRNNRFARSMDMKGKALESLDKYRTGQITSKEHATNVQQAYHEGLLTLKARGLDIDQQKADQVGQNMHEMMDIRRQYVQLKKQGLASQDNRHAQDLIQRYAKMKLENEQFNNNIAKQLQRKDSMGNYVYAGPDGKPIDASQFQTDFTAPEPPEPSPEEMAAADQELANSQQQVSGQVVRQPMADPAAAMRNQVQALDQQGQPAQAQAAPQAQMFGSRMQQLSKFGISPQAAKMNFVQNRMAKQGMTQEQAEQLWKQMGGQ